MKKSIKKAWVAALRSGEYKQGTGQLRNKRNEFCCLGVLCNLHAQAHPEIAANQTDSTRYLYSSTYPMKEVRDWAGVEATGGRVVINGKTKTLEWHNDNGCTFAEIADAIEAQL